MSEEVKIINKEEQGEIDPKQRILNSAAALFANLGYSSVGVREIAKDADVNLSMISYYFNGKVGLLKEIIKSFFEDLGNIILEVKCLEIKPDEIMKTIVIRIVDLFKEKPDHCKVAFMEMSIKPTELYQYKTDLLLQQVNMLREAFHKGRHKEVDKELLVIVAPAFFSMVYSHFIFSGLLKSTMDYEYDDKFLDRYAEVISTIFLKGVRGLRKENEQG